MSISILIVDDEADIRNLVKGILEDEGYKTCMAATSKDAYEQISGNTPDLVILDIWLQGSDQDGLEVLQAIKEKYPHIPVVMISGHGTIETAVSAIKQGAYDFIEKPFKSDRLLLMVRRALEVAHLKRENESLKQKVVVSDNLIGRSQVMQNLKHVLTRVATTNSRVLLTGEPGSGKDIAARFIHNNSNRANKPYLILSCATLRPERLEIELFGSEDGVMGEPAQTGVLERADGGTLLLDEVGDMPLETQGKIVRVLQNQNFNRVGGSASVHVDVRIIASTNRNLEEEIEAGNFRQDLYYRLNVVPINMPPLRDRPQDIPALAQYFLETLSRDAAKPVVPLSNEAVLALQAYEWPGNIRQLRNVVEWAMIMNSNGPDQPYGLDSLPPEINGNKNLNSSSGTGQTATGIVYKDIISMSLREAREAFERDYLKTQIKRFGGNISKTAEFVGMERSALHRKLKSLNIVPGETDGGATPVYGNKEQSA